MNTTLAIALLASLLVLCSKSGSAHYLYKNCGQQRTENSASVGPWTALLHENGSIFCAGTLITDAFILTAASCIRENEVNATEDAEDHLVQMSLRYRLFNNESLANNIGLLKLTKSVQLKPYIMPICIIIDPQQQPPAGLIGNAWTLDRDEYLTKEFGLITIQRKQGGCTNLDLYTQFCAGHSGDLEFCDGLMGSPLMQNFRYMHKNRYVQFGIATESDMDCQEARGYTDVMSFYWWIQDVVSLFNNAYVYKPKQSYVVGDNVKISF
ncbi:serine protease hepsin isoform X2 [Drosophila yakuba]|uniref:serine protease hepsin isoform X2 n=1 Tax=Drosophila yakuba TaxID=7245 RepID=UPI00193081CE|nr:serine protease hepsin isoform X2 [Drosophila yakuba]